MGLRPPLGISRPRPSVYRGSELEDAGQGQTDHFGTTAASSFPYIPSELHSRGRAQLRTVLLLLVSLRPQPSGRQLGFCLIPEKTQVPVYSLALPMSLILSCALLPGASVLAVRLASV